MGILSGNPKNEPMHYGEIFALWTYLMAEQGMRAGYQTLLNHAGDEDLKSLIQDKVNDSMKEEINEVQELLKENGIALPAAPPERPEANWKEIPAGARFTDPEIAMSLARDNAAGLISCSAIMGQAIREDISAIFEQFHTTKVRFGLRLLQLHKQKGWLIPPPLKTQTAEPAEV